MTETLTVDALFRVQARKTPGETAVIFDDAELTYADLEGKATRLAVALQKHGVRAESVVGVCLERSLDVVVALLGILMAGGAYLPLDPRDPEKRRAFMLEDARATLVLTQQRIAALLEEGDGDIEPPAEDDRLAYVIYTSGSTGQPKGVAMSHRPLVNLLLWQIDSSARTHAGKPGQKRALQYTPLNFDVSFLEYFSALASGGCVVVPTEEERTDPSRLLALIGRHRITSVSLPLVAMNHLADVGARTRTFPQSLAEIMTGGEQLRITPTIARFFFGIKGCTLTNIYGPTEAHLVTSFELRGDPATWPLLPPIGRPISGAEIQLLDEARNPVPDGEAGEVCIAGVCLARGYANRPDLTSERFVAGPRGVRVYKTGDLAKRSPDGTLMYLGRIDDQVKVHGVRVEPREIESVLGEHPGVRACAIAAQANVAGDRRLVAYVVPREDAPTDWAAFLAERLPSYLVPKTFVTMRALPTTSSGKIDVKALPEPSTGRPALGVPFVSPRTLTEKRVASIWRTCMQLDEVGIDDGFFDLGGTSLLLLRVQRDLARNLEREVPVVLLLQHPTVRALAAALDARDVAAKAPPAKRQSRRRAFLDPAGGRRTAP